MSATAPVLEGRNLTKYFWVKQGRGLFARKAPVHAVDNVSVSLEARKVTAFVGESGAGKTTVARILAEIIKPDKGTVLLDGKPVPPGRPRSYARQVQTRFRRSTPCIASATTSSGLSGSTTSRATTRMRWWKRSWHASP